MASKRRVLPKQERRGEILSAAAGVFAEKGYRAASINDVVEQAGVARGTFYHYFESKQDVFLEVIESYFSQFAAVLQQGHDRLVQALREQGDPVDAWREYALAVFRFHSENPELTAVVYREAMGSDEHFSSRVQKLSRTAVKELAQELKMVADLGLMVPVDTELASTMISGAVINVIIEYILGKKHADLPALADGLVTYHVRALTPRTR